MEKHGYDRRGFFGDVIHYDEKGHKVGTSRRSFFGGYVDYDASGKKIGRSTPNIFGGLNHYDNHGKRTGTSNPRMFGGSNHYDANGRKIGSSDPSFFGGWDYRRERQRESATAGAYHREEEQGSYYAGSYTNPPDNRNISYGSSASQYRGTSPSNPAEIEEKEDGGLWITILAFGYLIFCIIYMLNMESSSIWVTAFMWVFSGIVTVITILNNYGKSTVVILPRRYSGNGIYIRKLFVYLFVGLMTVVGVFAFLSKL